MVIRWKCMLEPQRFASQTGILKLGSFGIWKQRNDEKIWVVGELRWGFVLPRDHWKDGEVRKKKFFWQLCFSWSKRLVSWRKVHWVWFHERSMCFPEGKSIEFFFLNEERSSSERKKTQWTFLKENTLFVRETKLNGLSFRTPAFCFRRNKFAKKNFFSSVPHPPNDLLAKQSPISILLLLKFFRHLFVFIFRSCPVSVYFVTWRSWFFFLFAEF